MVIEGAVLRVIAPGFGGDAAVVHGERAVLVVVAARLGRDPPVVGDERAVLGIVAPGLRGDAPVVGHQGAILPVIALALGLDALVHVVPHAVRPLGDVAGDGRPAGDVAGAVLGAHADAHLPGGHLVGLDLAPLGEAVQQLLPVAASLPLHAEAGQVRRRGGVGEGDLARAGGRDGHGQAGDAGGRHVLGAHGMGAGHPSGGGPGAAHGAGLELVQGAVLHRRQPGHGALHRAGLPRLVGAGAAETDFQVVQIRIVRRGQVHAHAVDDGAVRPLQVHPAAGRDAAHGGRGDLVGTGHRRGQLQGHPAGVVRVHGRVVGGGLDAPAAGAVGLHGQQAQQAVQPRQGQAHHVARLQGQGLIGVRPAHRQAAQGGRGQPLGRLAHGLRAIVDARQADALLAPGGGAGIDAGGHRDRSGGAPGQAAGVGVLHPHHGGLVPQGGARDAQAVRQDGGLGDGGHRGRRAVRHQAHPVAVRHGEGPGVGAQRLGPLRGRRLAVQGQADAPPVGAPHQLVAGVGGGRHPAHGAALPVHRRGDEVRQAQRRVVAPHGLPAARVVHLAPPDGGRHAGPAGDGAGGDLQHRPGQGHVLPGDGAAHGVVQGRVGGQQAGVRPLVGGAQVVAHHHLGRRRAVVDGEGLDGVDGADAPDDGQQQGVATGGDDGRARIEAGHPVHHRGDGAVGGHRARGRGRPPAHQIAGRGLVAQSAHVRRPLRRTRAVKCCGPTLTISGGPSNSTR